MTNRQLIKELQKHPLDMQVFWQDFDCDDYGISAAPTTVYILDFDDATEEQTKSQNDFGLKGKQLIIRG